MNDDRKALRGAPPHTEDLLLARETIAGEPQARSRFAERMSCIPAILAARNVRLGKALEPNELDDLAQDIVVAVWKKLGDYQGRSSLENWVYSFCMLEILSALRKRRRRRARLEESGEGSLDSAAVTEEEPERGDHERLYAAVESLPAKQATVVRLRQFKQLSFDEIAAELGTSPNTVKTRYYRALVRLKDRLANLDPERSR